MIQTFAEFFTYPKKIFLSLQSYCYVDRYSNSLLFRLDVSILCCFAVVAGQCYSSLQNISIPNGTLYSPSMGLVKSNALYSEQGVISDTDLFPHGSSGVEPLCLFHKFRPMSAILLQHHGNHRTDEVGIIRGDLHINEFVLVASKVLKLRNN